MIGFTGTRAGLTKSQRITLSSLINDTSIIHGDCIGADEEFHKIGLQNNCSVLIRPCNLNSQRAFCKGGQIIAEPLSPLDRNKDIVNDSDEMIACPSGFEEVMRSGTWATIRYARKSGKKLTIIWPDGSIKIENE